MRAVETIKNIWKIEDLRNRILTTLLLVVIYRFGTFVVLPGIDPKALTALQEQTQGGLLALLDMFSGGAFSNASIFALGIMPYISASIVMQLMAIAVPSFQKLQREGESGHRKINQWTRYLTVAILLFQGPTYLVNLSVQLRAVGASLPPGIWFTISSTIILAAGSMFILWLGERITDKGVGNGIARLMFDTSVLLYVDRFCPETYPTKEDMELFEQFVVYAFVWAYSLRSQYTNLGWLSAQNYIMGESDKINTFNMYKLIAKQDTPASLLSALADILNPLSNDDIKYGWVQGCYEYSGNGEILENLKDEKDGVYENYLYFFRANGFYK